MAFLNLTTAIYWGQLSQCDRSLNEKAPQYSCEDTTAYGAVAAFASMLFTIQLMLTVVMFLWRGDLISEKDVFEGVSNTSSSHGGGSNSGYIPVNYSYTAPVATNPSIPVAPSADL